MQSHVIPVTIKTSEIHCIPCGLFRSNVFISRWPQVSVLLSVFHIQKWIISNLTHFISQPRRVQSHKQHINRLWWCSRARELFLQWHSTWTPSQIHFGRFWIEGNKAECSTAFFFFVVKTWPTGEQSSGKKKKSSPLSVVESESEHQHVHIYGDECGHKLMSLTCCTYLFLCVTMSHYAPVGIKQPSVIPGNALHAQTESKIHNATTDWSRNFTLHLRDTLHKQTHCST